MCRTLWWIYSSASTQPRNDGCFRQTKHSGLFSEPHVAYTSVKPTTTTANHQPSSTTAMAITTSTTHDHQDRLPGKPPSCQLPPSPSSFGHFPAFISVHPPPIDRGQSSLYRSICLSGSTCVGRASGLPIGTLVVPLQALASTLHCRRGLVSRGDETGSLDLGLMQLHGDGAWHPCRYHQTCGCLSPS